jgi:hypothetical protein
MENQPISSSPYGSSIKSDSIKQPIVRPQAKVNLLAPILSTFLVTAVVFGIGGYYLGKQSSNSQDVSIQPAPSAKTMNDAQTNQVINTNKSTYLDQKNSFSFEYPLNLKPLELSNGVVSFLPEDVYDSCKAAQGSKDMQAFEPCYKAVFNLNGFEMNPVEDYSKYSSSNKEVAKLSAYTDSQGRTWDAGLVLGQVYNFNAFSTVDNKPIKISFQYGFDAPSQEKVISFFNEILSTFKFTN